MMKRTLKEDLILGTKAALFAVVVVYGIGGGIMFLIWLLT